MVRLWLTYIPNTHQFWLAVRCRREPLASTLRGLQKIRSTRGNNEQSPW